MTIGQKILIKNASKILTKDGYRTHIIPGELLIELCNRDVDRVLTAHSENGIDAVDEKIAQYGRKLEAKIAAKYNSNNNYMFEFTGYKVDEDKRAIYVTLAPLKASRGIMNPSKLLKDKDGERIMGKKIPKDSKKNAATTLAEKKVKAYEDTEENFRNTITKVLPVEEAVGVAHDIMKDNNTLTPEVQDDLKDLHDKVSEVKDGEKLSSDLEKRIAKVVADTFDVLREMPIDNAVDTMNKIITVPEEEIVEPVPEEEIVEPVPEEEIVEPVPEEVKTESAPEPVVKVEDTKTSIDKKLEAAKKEAKKEEGAIKKEGEGVKGYDPATSVYTGKDEGPTPTFNREKEKKPKLNKEPILSDERNKPKTKTQNQPTMSQENYRKKSKLALNIVKKCVEHNLYPKSREQEEFDKLMDMDDARLQNMAEVVETVDPETSLVQEGHLVDLQEMFGEDE